MIVLSKSRVDDGQYHQIQIIRQRNQGTIIVDDGAETKRNGTGLIIFINLVLTNDHVLSQSKHPNSLPFSTRNRKS